MDYRAYAPLASSLQFLGAGLRVRCGRASSDAGGGLISSVPESADPHRGAVSSRFFYPNLSILPVGSPARHAYAVSHEGSRMTDAVRLLVVDNEPQSTRVLDGVLTSHAYHVRTAPDGESALAGFSSWRPHLVVADVYTPDLHEFELCRRIRAISKVPIIVLSAKDAEAAKVAALDAGADDYVTKPFRVNEFLARVRAALRRSGEGVPEVTELNAGDIRVDLATRRVYVAGLEVRLTPKEFDLFVYLVRRPNRIIEHRRLLEAVWGESSREHPEYLRVFVAQLRKKLEPDPSSPRYLVTEPWIGYAFRSGPMLAAGPA